jgi:hypothetical protein
MAAAPMQMRYLVLLSKRCYRAGLEPAPTRLSFHWPGLGVFS